MPDLWYDLNKGIAALRFIANQRGLLKYLPEIGIPRQDLWVFS
jgi:hypothetical protein